MLSDVTERACPNIDLLFDDLDASVEFAAPLGPMTWYRLGGGADVLVRPRSVEALATLVRRCHESGIPIRIIGSGANLLIDDDGVDGVVVVLDNPAFRAVSPLHRHRAHRGGYNGEAGDAVRVMAGAAMERLVMNTAGRGLSGLEMMAGIPASVGGALRMNAGGRFGEIGDAVSAVACINLNGEIVVYGRNELDFAYRSCSIADPVILWSEFRLTPDDPKRVHEKVKEIFRYKKSTQPLAQHSAGCVFKNPLSKSDRSRRISAGELIERAGLKGATRGGAVISTQHANFFVAGKGCTARDLIELMDLAARTVARELGYELVPEIVIWRRASQK